MAADEMRADAAEGADQRAEEIADLALGGARRDEDDRQEPAWPRSGHRDVARIDDHRHAAELCGRERDRVRGGDQRPACDLDRARILADGRPESKLGRGSWKLAQ